MKHQCASSITSHKSFLQEIKKSNSEVDKLLKKKVIIPCKKTTDDFVSPFFTRPKKDGTFRMILNLKSFNTFIKFKHCKLETFREVLSVIKPNCWMASVDLKDAYYSVGIFPGHWKYLKFFWEEQFYQFTAMPNGYGPAVRYFTKIMKKPFKVLRHNGHVSVIYIDDTFLEGDTCAACQQNIFETVGMLLSLGFTVHVPKSVLVPTQKLCFIGFVINSLLMTVSLTEEKTTGIIDLCSKLLSYETTKIRFLAKVIGCLVATFPAVLHGPLHYRSLEFCKIKALRISNGNFDAPVKLSDHAQKDLHWWIAILPRVSKPINMPQVDLVIFSDASLEG